VQQAAALAGDAREIALVRAEVLEHSGEIEAAIEQRRRVHEIWPENIAATFALATLLGQTRSADAEAERLSLLTEILANAPENLRARSEQARVAAALERAEPLRTALDALLRNEDQWPEASREHLLKGDEAARAGDFRSATRSLTFFENLIKPTPDYQQSLAQLGASETTIGTPIRTFLRLELPAVTAAEADLDLSFESQPAVESDVRPDLLLTVERAGEAGATVVSLSDGTLRVGDMDSLPFPGETAAATPASVAAGDLNFDFRPDLIAVGAEGLRVFLGQEDGAIVPQELELAEFDQPWTGVWTVDVEADGDLDLLLSDGESLLRWIRNNGDMTFAAMNDFIPAEAVRDLEAVDLDGDGDVDLATLDAAGTVVVWQNERAGTFVKARAPVEGPQTGIAVGDMNRDGRFDLVAVSSSGKVHYATRQADGTWAGSPLAEWQPVEAAPGDVVLEVVDLDNNGAVDLLASTFDRTAMWLGSAAGSWTALPAAPAMRVTSVADVNADGRLDLVGLSETAGVVAANQSDAGYAWQVIEPRANTAPGDQRINSFGVGGRIEVRAGTLAQAAAVRSPRVHFGLGEYKQADVARIVWPNGTVQAEFALPARETVVANQRLKGSCPWVFAFDGEQFRFVKDFIWRSPLGLRINAQATAGVLQTEDWIKIAGEHLAAANGHYRMRITAELWETHFFDHVGLMAVDHPADVEVFVDERFVANAPPALRVIVTTPPEPLLQLRDHRGDSLDDSLRSIDAVYADTFDLGKYQGVAQEHWVEFELPDDVAADRRVLLVGHGWVYPTDSSLNVALSQDSAAAPFGLILEQQDASGPWRTVRENLGFPAGKNKDVVIELPGDALSGSAVASRRFRLRTNMEIYWDALGWCYAVEDVEPRIAPLPAQVAELRRRGYSKLLRPVHRRRPDTPVYEVAASGQPWLDLEGYYTRFGDVRELLAGIDDRYVIMNAGDELVFEFASGDEPPEGWQRDFVLVGDGWVKDGDFNTAFSQWVRPLPLHSDVDYAGPLRLLEDDPGYQKHPDDWLNYHTRYVTTRHFQQGLWSVRSSSPPDGIAGKSGAESETGSSPAGGTYRE
jgi:hypothetical protein